ncbi:MAG: GyrI-like domain-containing protein [Chloroflexota bacterium]
MAGTVTLEPVEFLHPIDRNDELRSVAAVRFLELPSRACVMIDGEGPPEPAVFSARMPGLYTAAWSLRFALKRRGIVTRVGPLEGLWWTLDGTIDLDAIFGDHPGDRETWRWSLFIALPDEATEAEIEAALAPGRAKLGAGLAPGLRVESFAEGRVAQVLHLGPYATERPTIERLHAAIAAAGLRPRGRHHEIYLGIPGKGAPERLRTILRQPVE